MESTDKKIKIKVDKLRKCFGDLEVLKDISTEITEGEVLVILGPSGSGKSTFLRCLNRLEDATAGTIIVDDIDITAKKVNMNKVRENIGMVFQHFNLFNNMNVLDNLMLAPLELKKADKKEARARAEEMLKRVDLLEKADSYPSQLSGGQKQRVAIARALASNPKILLCDEATSALDPQTTASILELLKSINEQFQITIVIITHQMSVIREICNRVAIIEHGELVENGLVEDIFSHPKSKAARELILRDVPENSGKAEGAVAAQMERIQGDKKLRIVFTENSAFEPVIANMILQFGKPVNILRADTKNVGGVAKGEMILGLPDDRHLQIDMEQYLTEHGLEIEEVTGDVE